MKRLGMRRSSCASSSNTKDNITTSPPKAMDPEIEELLSAKIPERPNSTFNDENNRFPRTALSFGLSPIKRGAPVLSSQASPKKLSTGVKLTYMETVLSCSGLILRNEPAVELKVDQTSFIRDVTSALSAKPSSTAKNVEQFVKDFKDYHSNTQFLIKSLFPCMMTEDSEAVRGTMQDSLVRLLLQVDVLQPKLLDWLLDKLGECTGDNAILGEEYNSVTWTRLLLQPLRFLNFLNNSDNFCERLFDMIHTASDETIKQEIITSLPDIISDSEHHYAAGELSKLLKSNQELLPAILDALNNLCVQSDIKNEVRQSVIISLHKSRPEFLSNIVKFLLSTSDSSSYNEVINGLRSELFPFRNVLSQQSQNISQSIRSLNRTNPKQLENIQLSIFGNIRDSLLSNKALYDAWLRNISDIKTHHSYKSVDFLVLLLLWSIACDMSRKRAIETVVKNQIKQEILRTSVVEDTLKKFLGVVQEYFSSMLLMFSKLLKSSDPVAVDFVSASYMLCFEHMTSYWIKMLVSELLAYVGAGDASNANVALDILYDVSSKYSQKLQPFSSMLTVLLNKLSDLQLNETYRLMDMLCCVAFTDEDDTSVLKDDLYMLIQKQLANTNLNVLKSGIIGAIMAMKHIAKVPPNESNDTPEQSEEIELTPRAKKAYKILKLVMERTESNAETQVLLYDHLGTILTNCNNLDRTLLYQTSRIMIRKMKMNFLVTPTEFQNIEFIDCSPQFGLNEDVESVILNLTPKLVEEINMDQNTRNSVCATILHPLFRLLKCLERQNLIEIDALLECPIVMPTFSTTMQDFANLSSEQQTVVMDSLFHLTNWFREVLNCFADLVSEGRGDKVLIRLRTIVWLQNWISRCLPSMMIADYCPPRCNFFVTAKRPTLPSEKAKKKGPTKGKKPKGNVNSTVAINRTISQPLLTQEDDESLDALVDMKLYKPFFRELDIEVWSLLTVPFVLNPQPEKDCLFTPELGPSELCFLLEDYVEKLQLVFSSEIKRNRWKLESFCFPRPIEIASKSIDLLPNLCEDLEIINTFCQQLLEANDGVYDNAGMFMPESRNIRLSASLIFKSLTLLFGWENFRSTSKQDLLTAALHKIASRSSSKKDFPSMKVLVKECVKYFSIFESLALHLDSALNLIIFLDILNKYSEDVDIQKVINDMCWRFLSRRWYTIDGIEEKGAAYNRNIETMLSIYFSTSENRFKSIEDVNNWLTEEVNYLTSKDSTLKTFPTISRNNFNIMIRTMCRALGTGVRQTVDKNMGDKEKLEIWVSVTVSLESLVTILKVQDMRQNLISFIKGTGPIFKLFLSHGMTVCGSLFKVDSLLVSQVLKKLQVATRYIQNICNHTKVTEDPTLGSYLPNMRSLLESLLLKVKNMMILNGCTDAFFMGSMRNRDLKGNELHSEVEEMEEGEEENEEAMEVDNEQENDIAEFEEGDENEEIAEMDDEND